MFNKKLINEGSFNKGIIFGILCPFFAAIMLVSLRKLGKTDHPSTTALWYNIFGAIVFLVICMLIKTEWPDYDQVLIVLIVIGVVSSLQQICLAYSLKLAPASLLAPLRYISVPIGILIGVYLFNESLTSTFYIGTLIIISSSLIIIRRETQKKS